MGVLDKIKNALFEVEYVEVEEPPKKEKKEKVKKEKEEKPIAKKVILPGKKEEKIEELKEEELLDEDFEIRPKEEQEVEKVHDSFKFMDDNDFKVDEEEYLNVDYKEPEILEEKPLYNDYEDKIRSHKAYDNPNYSSTNLYGMNNNYNVPVHQYGTYEKEEKTYFKPSPIISPIYGILDKNYKKEDVKEKKEVRLSSYTRGNVDVDDIRAKAYGKQKEVVEEEEEVKFDVEKDDTMVDLSDRSKPEVKELTVGDAEEYFEDLGLEYNVDYVDVSTEKKATKEEEIEEKIEELKETPSLDETPIEEKNVPESNEEDDNLFDLIDSMYQENE